MFHFPAYPPARKLVPAHNSRRVSPFGHPRIKALSAAPRGLSRPHTSFIGTVCQGIHHTPLQAHTPARPHEKHQTTRQPSQQGTAGVIDTKNNDHKTINNNYNEPPPPTGDGGRSTKRTHEPRKTRGRVTLASTLQFSNHQPAQDTPHPNTGRDTPWGARNTTPPHTGEAGGGPGTQQHAPHHNSEPKACQ